MPLANSSKLQTLFFVFLSFFISANLWYVVVARDHVETQLDVRVEYRGLPDGLVMREGLVNRITVRLRGSAELLRDLHTRDLVYTADLSDIQRGANALPLNLSDLPEFKPFTLQEVIPSKLVIEVDSILERVIPLKERMLPLPPSSPYVISNVMLEPSFVTVKGPESRITPLQELVVSYDPTKNFSEGRHTANVAISAPSQIDVTPPLTSLRYTLEAKTRTVTLKRQPMLDDGTDSCTIIPDRVNLKIAVPEAMAGDRSYLETAKVMVYAPSDLADGQKAEVSPFVMLPSGAKLESIDPTTVSVIRKPQEKHIEPEWIPAETSFSIPIEPFGMNLSPSKVSRNFSLDDLELPPAAVPQPDDLKVQTVMPSENATVKPAPTGESAGPMQAVSPVLPEKVTSIDLSSIASPEEK